MAEPDFYIATAPLSIGFARAHNPGDPVPAANVKANGWEDGVARPGTKAANEAQGIAEEPAAAATLSK